MKVQSYVAKPAGAVAAAQIVIADPDSDRAIAVPTASLRADAAFGTQWGEVERLVANAVAGAVGPQLGAPIKIAALIMNDRDLFARASVRATEPGDGAKLAAFACSSGSAIASALGFSAAKNVLKIGNAICTIVAETQKDYVALDGKPLLDESDIKGFLERTAERSDPALPTAPEAAEP